MRGLSPVRPASFSALSSIKIFATRLFSPAAPTRSSITMRYSPPEVCNHLLVAPARSAARRVLSVAALSAVHWRSFTGPLLQCPEARELILSFRSYGRAEKSATTRSAQHRKETSYRANAFRFAPESACWPGEEPEPRDPDAAAPRHSRAATSHDATKSAIRRISLGSVSNGA